MEIKPISEIKIRLGVEPGGRVQRYFQSACYRYMDKYVPMDQGDLRTNVDLSDPNYIIYESPYARYQYYGVREDGSHVVRNYTTAGTGPYWDKQMVSAEIRDLEKEVQTYIKHGGK